MLDAREAAAAAESGLSTAAARSAKKDTETEAERATRLVQQKAARKLLSNSPVHEAGMGARGANLFIRYAQSPTKRFHR